jgi:uncharacterized repeat protein (TIGR01451 family)
MTVLAGCLVAWHLVCGGTVWALGTPASTSISSTASISYTQVGGSDPVTITASTRFNVLEIIDGVITWQDATDIAVNSPHEDAVLVFLLTNTGNGPESYQLSVSDNLAGDDFNPLARALWLETNGAPGLQISGADPDILYENGLNDPLLSADGSQVIYMTNDIPTDQADNARGQVQLIIQAATPGAAGAEPGTELIGHGLNGGNAVVGATRAMGSAAGWFQVASVDVELAKSIAAISDTTGGHQPYTGARVTYRIQVSVSGTGRAEGLVISDAIPADMTFIPGTITLDGISQSDAGDMPADPSDFDVTNPATVTVNLGDVNAPAVRVIEFATTIN